MYEMFLYKCLKIRQHHAVLKFNKKTKKIDGTDIKFF